MTRRWMLSMSILVGLTLSGCDEEKASEPSPTAAAKSDEIGVAECDEWVDKMSGCLDKMTEQERAAAEPVFKQNQEQWKKAAAEGATHLGPTCKAALEAYAQNPRCQ